MKIEIRHFYGEPLKEGIIGYIENGVFDFKSEKIKKACLKSLKQISEECNWGEAYLHLRDMSLKKNKDYLKYVGFVYAYISLTPSTNNKLIALTYKKQ